MGFLTLILLIYPFRIRCKQLIITILQLQSNNLFNLAPVLGNNIQKTNPGILPDYSLYLPTLI